MSETQNLKETGSLPMSVNFSVRLGLLPYKLFISRTTRTTCYLEDMRIYTLQFLLLLQVVCYSATFFLWGGGVFSLEYGTVCRRVAD